MPGSIDEQLTPKGHYQIWKAAAGAGWRASHMDMGHSVCAEEL